MPVLRLVRQFLASINIERKAQSLRIDLGEERLLDRPNAQAIVDFLQQHPKAVKTLIIRCRRFSAPAAQVVRTFFAETRTLQEISITLFAPQIGNELGGQLLSSLHCNTSVTVLELIDIGLEGEVGGGHLAALLRNNSHLQVLNCFVLSLGMQGVRALLPALHLNQTLQGLNFDNCGLGDEGVSIVVNALREITTLRGITLSNSDITSNGLPHLTELINKVDSLNVSYNPGLFDDEENTRLFFLALSQNTKLYQLRLKSCRLPVHAFTAVFQALTINTKLEFLSIHDQTQLQGQGLVALLERLPRMRNLFWLQVNIDVMDESVLSSIYKNTSIQLLAINEDDEAEVTDRPIMEVLSRNRRLCYANELLANEPRGMDHRSGLWALGIEDIAKDSIGATAIYKILRQKLALWWLPEPTTTTISVATTTATTTSSSSSSNDEGKRTHTSRAPTVDNGEASTAATEHDQKRPRLS